MPDLLGPGGWAYWRERFTRADAERTHLRAEVEQQRKQWEDIWRRNVDLLAEIERLEQENKELKLDNKKAASKETAFPNASA
jgi:septal ring factor EnvC (AmiA/AmiB activator)